MISPGVALVRRVVADMHAHGLEPDGREQELLNLAEKLGDRLDALERTIDADGMTYVSKGGLARLHPAVPEARQTAAALARVLGGIDMDGSGKNPKKVAAAQARWRQHNIARAGNV
jgi:hypothetical protein